MSDMAVEQVLRDERLECVESLPDHCELLSLVKDGLSDEQGDVAFGEHGMCLPIVCVGCCGRSLRRTGDLVGVDGHSLEVTTGLSLSDTAESARMRGSAAVIDDLRDSLPLHADEIEILLAELLRLAV